MKRGVRFVYCSVCDAPVAKINFTTRHHHKDVLLSNKKEEQGRDKKGLLENITTATSRMGREQHAVKGSDDGGVGGSSSQLQGETLVARSGDQQYEDQDGSKKQGANVVDRGGIVGSAELDRKQAPSASFKRPRDDEQH